MTDPFTNTVSVNLPATNGFVYDSNGNLTSDGKRGLDFDDENQLTRVTVTNDFKKEFVYDGLNRLRIKREYEWRSSAWVQTKELRFVYDGNLILQHRDGNNLPLLTLTRGNDLSGSLQGAGGIGGLLAMTESLGIDLEHSYYHADGNGNITAMTSSNQLIAARHSYDSFGSTLSLSGAKSEANPYWFSSQFYDAETDFYHYVRRVYVPAWQRWVNHDPIGQLDGVNLFRFVGNDSINQIDPLGLEGYALSGPGWFTTFQNGQWTYNTVPIAPPTIAPLNSLQQQIVNQAINDIRGNGFPKLADNLTDKAKNGQIFFNKKLDDDVFGKVNKICGSKNIQLNPNLFPNELRDDNTALQNTLSHEWVHTQQFSDIGNTGFWLLADGLANIVVGVGTGFNGDKVYRYTPTEVMARKLSQQVTPGF